MASKVIIRNHLYLKTKLNAVLGDNPAIKVAISGGREESVDYPGDKNGHRTITLTFTQPGDILLVIGEA